MQVPNQAHRPRPSEAWNETPRLKDRRSVDSRVDVRQRAETYGHGAATILISGLSGSGKTTLALALEERLFQMGCKTVLLDGQNLRLGLSRDLGFSLAERSENLRRAAELARINNRAGLICVAAFAAPERDVRQRVRELVGPECFLHVHLEASVDTCRRRDASGIYAAADRGEISDFIGVSAPYDEATDAELVLNTEQASVAECVEQIIDLLRRRQMLR